MIREGKTQLLILDINSSGTVGDWDCSYSGEGFFNPTYFSHRLPTSKHFHSLKNTTECYLAKPVKKETCFASMEIAYPISVKDKTTRWHRLPTIIKMRFHKRQEKPPQMLLKDIPLPEKWKHYVIVHTLKDELIVRGPLFFFHMQHFSDDFRRTDHRVNRSYAVNLEQLAM